VPGVALDAVMQEALTARGAGIDGLDELLRAEVGYLGAAMLLCGLLAAVHRRPSAR